MNLPNKLTLTRIILVPVFMVFVSLTQIGTEDFNPTWYLVAGIIFAAASFTDFLDYFGTALTWGNSVMIGADCVFLSYWLCWLVAIATAISGIKYLWDNRSFINTAK